MTRAVSLNTSLSAPVISISTSGSGSSSIPGSGSPVVSVSARSPAATPTWLSLHPQNTHQWIHGGVDEALRLLHFLHRLLDLLQSSFVTLCLRLGDGLTAVVNLE